MSTISRRVRICVIGAGPSGLSFMHQLAKNLAEEEEDRVCERWKPEVVCYEKQGDLGGLWNFTWRTGTGPGGENVHGSMYNHMWINAPKETDIECPDYTYEKHFGKELPSYVPREVNLDYIRGRFSQHKLTDQIRFYHVVTSVTFDPSTLKFTVSTRDVSAGEDGGPHESFQRQQEEETFDYVVNCTGHFSVPDAPAFEGMSTFPGRILHSHDFRNPSEFKGQDVLIVGAFKSAEDIAVILYKFGARRVVMSYRTKPKGFKGPKEITERPLLTRIEGEEVHFRDGSSAKFNSIILATGYVHHYPYLHPDLRLTGPNSFYPDRLYKGIVWIGKREGQKNNKNEWAGQGRMMYIGTQKEFFSLRMFDVQALWAVKWIKGLIPHPTMQEMEENVAKWREGSRPVGVEEINHFHGGYLISLAEEAGYGHNVDSREDFARYVTECMEDVTGYRDKCYRSLYTGKMAPEPKIKYMDYKKRVDLKEFVDMY